MERKNIIFLLVISIFLVTLLLFYTRKMDQNTLVQINNDNIAIMIENELGDYVKSNNLKFPTDLYLNHEKSYCENGSTLTYNQTTKKLVLTGNESDKCYAYFDKRFSSYITNLYDNNLDIGDGELNYHNNTIDVNADGIIDDAGDFSYRYLGNNPYNFVCFGTDDCSKDENNDHLYRIIGVFPMELEDGSKEFRVKLIKSEYITEEELGAKAEGKVVLDSYTSYARVKNLDIDGFYWSGDVNINYNNWNESVLNQFLNNNFLAKINTDYVNLIAESKWFIGGNGYEAFADATMRETYNNEIGKNRRKEGDLECLNGSVNAIVCTKELLETNKKIGLMYVNDFGFATTKENWINTFKKYSNDVNRKNNWIYNGISEWTITRGSGRAYFNSSWTILSVGGAHLSVNGHINNSIIGVRPTFYLKNSIKYLSGNGSEDNPFYISLN